MRQNGEILWFSKVMVRVRVDGGLDDGTYLKPTTMVLVSKKEGDEVQEMNQGLFSNRVDTAVDEHPELLQDVREMWDVMIKYDVHLSLKEDRDKFMDRIFELITLIDSLNVA